MWQFDPNQYEESNFSIIPAGDHRVRIEDVISKKSKAGNDMFEITLAVSSHSSKLWYYLVLDPSDPKKTNQRSQENQSANRCFLRLFRHH